MEIDIGPIGYYLVLENAKHMELITPFNINYFAILQPYPDEISFLHVMKMFGCFSVGFDQMTHYYKIYKNYNEDK